MDNYHYIIAGLPLLILNGENRSFSYKRLRDEIYNGCSEKDRRLIRWLEFGSKESNLCARFYRAALSHQNEYIRNYFAMDLQIRNKKVEYVVRESKNNMPESAIDTYKVNEAGCPVLNIDDAAELDKIFRTKDILEKEKMLDKYKWEKINAFTLYNYFDIEKILSFLSKAMLIERWERLDTEKGKELFEKLVMEVKGTFKGVNGVN